MRFARHSFTPATTAAILAMVFIAGCNGLPKTPEQRYVAVMASYDALNRTFTAAAKSGMLTDEQIVATEPLWQAGDRQIEILRRHYKDKSPSFIAAIKSLEHIYDAVQAWWAVSTRRQ